MGKFCSAQERLANKMNKWENLAMLGVLRCYASAVVLDQIATYGKVTSQPPALSSPTKNHPLLSIYTSVK